MFDLVRLVVLCSHVLPPAGATAAPQAEVGGRGRLAFAKTPAPGSGRTRRFTIRRKSHLKVDATETPFISAAPIDTHRPAKVGNRCRWSCSPNAPNACHEQNVRRLTTAEPHVSCRGRYIHCRSQPDAALRSAGASGSAPSSQSGRGRGRGVMQTAQIQPFFGEGRVEILRFPLKGDAALDP